MDWFAAGCEQVVRAHVDILIVDENCGPFHGIAPPNKKTPPIREDDGEQ
jgi:hypothetical protein